MRNGGFVYIICNPDRTTLYTGVTSNLQRRVWEHKNKIHENSFTKQYNCVVLVWYKYYDDIVEAIKEEKRIKAGKRVSKEKLIDSMNREWKDLWDEIVEQRLY